MLARAQPEAKRLEYAAVFMSAARVAARSAADALVLPHWTLREWKSKHLEQDGKVEQNIGSVTAADLQQEVSRLRRELEYAQRQRDILKKALGILSEEPLKRGMP